MMPHGASGPTKCSTFMKASGKADRAHAVSDWKSSNEVDIAKDVERLVGRMGIASKRVRPQDTYLV